MTVLAPKCIPARISGAVALTASVLLWVGETSAATYQVGPGRTYPTIQDIQDKLQPGDVVEVDGDATYPGGIHLRRHAQPNAPIVIRGILKNNKPPVLSGGNEFTIVFHGDNYTFQTFEITGGAEYCVVHKANNILLSDIVVHDCPKHGILGTDDESGSLTIEHAEVYNCGDGEKKHQLYIATDEITHPGSVFRLQFSYIHSAKGGNNVKSRAERNEIYYNWIEGAKFHGLDLIGPDGKDANLAREDSDVVGNVVITTSAWQIARMGGDATGYTAGRYRLVNNTFIIGPNASIALRMQERVDSLEMHNNVFYKLGTKEVQLLRYSDPSGPEPAIRGTNNWVSDGIVDVPDGLSATRRGDAPGFADEEKLDLNPANNSALIDNGTSSTVRRDDHLRPKPLVLPVFLPPIRQRLMVGSQVARTVAGAAIDIGAFESGSLSSGPPSWGGPTDPPPWGSSGTGGGTNSSGSVGDNSKNSSCVCGFSHSGSGMSSLALLIVGLAGCARRRKTHMA